MLFQKFQTKGTRFPHRNVHVFHTAWNAAALILSDIAVPRTIEAAESLLSFELQWLAGCSDM